MAAATPELVCALRVTALRLTQGAAYRWSHFARCNCGNLAQVLTDFSPREIYEAAFARPGDWGEQAREYCPGSGLAMDEIMGRMIRAGLEPEDMRHLERLSHPHVLRLIAPARLPLRHTSREDTVLFLETWADLLASRMGDLQRVELRRLERKTRAESAFVDAA